MCRALGGRAVPFHPIPPSPHGYASPGPTPGQIHVEILNNKIIWILEIQDQINMLLFFSPPLLTHKGKKKKRIKGHFPKVFQYFVWVFPPDLHLLQLCCTSVHSSHVKLDFGCPCERCLGTNTKKSPFPHCLPPSSASSSRKNRWKWPGWIPKLGMFSGVTHWQKTENKCI